MNAPATTVDRATGEISTSAASAPTTDFDRLLQQTFSPREILDGDSLEKMYRVADSLANSKISVPEHLRGNVGDCLAIVTQAMLWNMNPFAVAQKTHIVSGRLGYEAQLVNAVLQNSGAVRGLPHYEYKGDGNGLECRVGFVVRGSADVVFGEWLKIAEVTTKNSPLWKTNPKQQLGYLQIKNWARAFVPGAILGVYTVDELEDTDLPQRPNAEATPRDLPRNATPAQVGAAAAAKPAAPSASLKAIVDGLELTAFNKGSAALAEAWQALTKADRTAIGPAQLDRLKGIAKECDDIAATARAQADAEAAAQQQAAEEPGDGQ